MINSDEILRLARINKLKPHQQEKHYAQTLVLSGIYSYIVDELVFKGGTALFFFRGLDRFSEDLDFTQTAEYDHNKLKTSISEMLGLIGATHEIKDVKSVLGKKIKVKIEGPLYKLPINKTVVDIDISLRKDIVLKPEILEVIPMYDDVRPFTVPVMKKEETLAEKIRAITTRGLARDLYDTYFLLKKGTELDPELVNKKLSMYNEKLDLKKFDASLIKIEKIWEPELGGLIPRVPPFKDVSAYVLSTVSTKLNSQNPL